MKFKRRKIFKLREVVDINPRTTLKKGTEAKKIAMTNVKEFTRRIEAYEVEEFKSGSKFKNNDTLFARITPCLENGKTAFVDILDADEVAFGSTEFFVLRAKANITDPKFIYYLSISDEFRNTAIQSMTGTSGRQRAQKEALLDYDINLPSLHEQRLIGRTLSLLDEKIEKNNSIISNLEELAQTLFKRWFVDFEFPNENGEPYKSSGGKMVESELGMIPENFKVEKLSVTTNFLSGGTPKTKEKDYWNGEIPFFTPKDITGSVYVTSTEKYITELGLDNCNSKLYPKNTLFITARGTVGKLNLSNKDMAMNQSCFALKHKQNTQYYLYFSVKALLREIIQGATGAVFNAINLRDLNNLKTINPTNELVNKFETMIASIFEIMSLKEDENIKLKNIRDSLLPKLLSGEIELPDILEVTEDVPVS